MARDGSGVYSLPAGSTATTGETIIPSVHNTPLLDLETDMNTARPIVAGGTGATSVSGARTNLGIAADDEVYFDEVRVDTWRLTEGVGGSIRVSAYYDGNTDTFTQTFTDGTTTHTLEVDVPNDLTTLSGTSITFDKSGASADMDLTLVADVGQDQQIYFTDGDDSLITGLKYTTPASAATASLNVGSASLKNLNLYAGATDAINIYCGSANQDAKWTSSYLLCKQTVGVDSLIIGAPITFTDEDTAQIDTTSSGVEIWENNFDVFVDIIDSSGEFNIRNNYQAYSSNVLLNIDANGNATFSGTGSFSGGDITVGHGGTNGYVNVATGALEIRMNSTDTVRVGGDSALEVIGAGTNANPLIYMDETATDAAHNGGLYFDTGGRFAVTVNGTTVARIDGDGTTVGADVSLITREAGDARYAAISTMEVKSNVVPKALDTGAIIDAINVNREFDWAMPDKKSNRLRSKNGKGWGLIIEELEQVYENGVIYREVTDENGEDTGEYKAFSGDNMALISLLIGEVQSLRRRLEDAGIQ